MSSALCPKFHKSCDGNDLEGFFPRERRLDPPRHHRQSSILFQQHFSRGNNSEELTPHTSAASPHSLFQLISPLLPSSSTRFVPHSPPASSSSIPELVEQELGRGQNTDARTHTHTHTACWYRPVWRQHRHTLTLAGPPHQSKSVANFPETYRHLQHKQRGSRASALPLLPTPPLASFQWG